MPRQTFAYSEIHLPGIFRPIIRATLRANSRLIRCYVVPDSGADYSVFPVSFALPLGFDLLNMPTDITVGVEGTGLTTYFGDVEVDLGHGIRWTARVGFLSGLDKQGIGLLGQHDFFQKYRVLFDRSKLEFHIDFDSGNSQS